MTRHPNEEDGEEGMEEGERESSSSPSEQEKDVLVRNKTSQSVFSVLFMLMPVALPLLHQQWDRHRTRSTSGGLMAQSRANTDTRTPQGQLCSVCGATL